jgi:hypothetical protein
MEYVPRKPISGVLRIRSSWIFFILSPFLISICAALLSLEHFGWFTRFPLWVYLTIARWQVRLARNRARRRMRRLPDWMTGIRR